MLDKPGTYGIYMLMLVSKRKRKTLEAAKAVGLSLRTLDRWMAEGKVKAPKLIVVHGRAVRLWTQKDIARLRKVKEEIYRRGQGVKKKAKK